MTGALVQLSSVQLAAYDVLATALHSRPAFCTALDDYPATSVVIALIDLEQAFGIDLDVDEALAARTVGGLLTLVEAKVGPAPLAPPVGYVGVYDLTAFRAAIGRPIRAERFVTGRAAPDRGLSEHPWRSDAGSGSSFDPTPLFEAWGPSADLRRTRPLSPSTVARLARALASARREPAAFRTTPEGDTFVVNAEFSVVGGPDWVAGEPVRNVVTPRRAGPRPLEGLAIFAIGALIISLAMKACALRWPA